MWNHITTRTVSDEPHSLNNPSRCYTVSLGVFMRFPVNVSLFHNLHLFSNKDEPTSVAEAWSQFAALTWLGVLWRSHSVGCCLVWDTGGGGVDLLWEGLIIQILLRMLQRTDGMWRFKRSLGQRAFELWPLTPASLTKAGDKGGWAKVAPPGLHSMSIMEYKKSEARRNRVISGLIKAALWVLTFTLWWD